MTRRTTTAALAAVLLVATGAALQPGCARRAGGTSPQAGGVLAAASRAPDLRAVRPAGASATPPASASALWATTPAPVSGGDRLEAVRMVKLFCDLFGSQRRRQARELLDHRGILRARELQRARGLAFVSARVKTHARAGTLVVAASVRVQPRRGSLPRTSVGTLFFTLGRVGTTTGGWLITAVTTSP